MKKSILTLALAISALAIGAAELKIKGNSVEMGAPRLNMLKNCNVTITGKDGLYTNFYLYFTTNHKAKWLSMGNALCNSKMQNDDTGLWKYTAAVPVSDTEKADTVYTVSVTPFGTVELAGEWKTANMKNIIEAGLFISLPVKKLGENSFVMDGKVLKTVNETKYGWKSGIFTNAKFTFYKDSPMEYSVETIGKYYITIGTVKDSAVTVRIIPLPGTGKVKLAVLPK